MLDRSKPNAAPVVTFTSSCSQRDCRFDASGSRDADGWIATFRWDFGDGTGLIQAGRWTDAWHTFNVPGTYTVTLTATDDEGATASVSERVAIVLAGAPTASFTVSCAGLSCSFNGDGSSDSDGTIASYSWSFGDGASASSATAMHTYGHADTYAAKLTVTNNAGASATLTTEVAVTNLAPTAAFVVTCSGLRCTLDGSGSADRDGTVASYAWSFGDGSNSSGKTTSHDYEKAGTYTITLTVLDNDGASALTSQRINPISLSARGYKQGNQQKVELSWSGVTGTSYDVYGDGRKIANVQATTYTDVVPKGPGTHTYRVCAPATGSCSNEATGSF